MRISKENFPALVVTLVDDLVCVSADDDPEQRACSCTFVESSSEYSSKTTIGNNLNIFCSCCFHSDQVLQSKLFLGT